MKLTKSEPKVLEKWPQNCPKMSQYDPNMTRVWPKSDPYKKCSKYDKPKIDLNTIWPKIDLCKQNGRVFKDVKASEQSKFESWRKW